jgi:3-isopropylmalate dehydrogenase
MHIRLCLLPGDGIGPEIMAQAAKVLTALADRFGHHIEMEEAQIGGAALDAGKDPLPEETVEACKRSDAVLLGAVGGPAWDGLPHERRPERGLLAIRKELGLFANLRPALVFEEFKRSSCLRPDIVDKGVNLLVVRELTGGVYFGQPKGVSTENGQRVGRNTMVYSEAEVRRIAELAFQIAGQRSGRLCSVDKANVLDVSRLWREVVTETAADFPGVELSHMYVDNAAMQLVRDPAQFDVLVTSNLFGDILSDEAAAITGSIGLLPSASLGLQGGGLFEPVHGSAPDIAGQDQANPLGTVLSVAMLLRHALGLEQEAAEVERAVRGVLAEGYRTPDLSQAGTTPVGCAEMGRLLSETLRSG